MKIKTPKLPKYEDGIEEANESIVVVIKNETKKIKHAKIFRDWHDSDISISGYRGNLFEKELMEYDRLVRGMKILVERGVVDTVSPISRFFRRWKIFRVIQDNYFSQTIQEFLSPTMQLCNVIQFFESNGMGHVCRYLHPNAYRSAQDNIAGMVDMHEYTTVISIKTHIEMLVNPNTIVTLVFNVVNKKRRELDFRNPLFCGLPKINKSDRRRK